MSDPLVAVTFDSYIAGTKAVPNYGVLGGSVSLLPGASMSATNGAGGSGALLCAAGDRSTGGARLWTRSAPLTGDFCVDVRARVDTLNGTDNQILTIETGVGFGTLQLFVSTSRAATFKLSTSVTGPAVTLGVLTHFRVDRYNGVITFYVDGAVVGTLTTALTLDMATTVYLGTYNSVGYSLFGYVDDFVVWDESRARGAAFTPPAAMYYPPITTPPAAYLSAATTHLSAFATPSDFRLYNADAITASRDIYFGGDGMIVDKVSKKSGSSTVPVVRRVRLHEQLSGIVVAETWSGTDGRYAFANLSRAYSYYAVAFDHTGEYPAGVIAENLVPERMQ